MRVSHLIVVFLGSAVACSAQIESLRIGSGDMVHVKVLEASELDQSVRVTDSGAIPLIIGGDVKVQGLTPREAAFAVESALTKGNYVLTPHVSLTLEQAATQNVTVIGEVHAPGNYAIQTPRSIIEVLSLAGGVTNMADRNITVERRSTKEQFTYYLSNDPKVSLDTKILIFPGDSIVVPKVHVVYMLGDFGRPGAYEMSTNNSQLSAIQAMTLAGGTPPSAVPSRARLIRKQADGTVVESKIQLSAIQKGKQPDVRLEPNDIIYVPFSYMRNMVTNLGGLMSAAGSAAVYRF